MAHLKDLSNDESPHLKDLFGKGEEVTVVDTSGNEYIIFVVRPTSLQQEDARTKANGRLAKFKLDAMDPDSDRSVALRFTFSEIVDFDELVDMRLRYDEADAQELAFNELVHDEDSEWSKDDRYMDLIAGIADRMSDIQKYNEQMEDGDSEDRITFDEDGQLAPMLAEQDRFRADLDVRIGKLEAEQRKIHAEMDEDELRSVLISKAIDLEARMTWYEAYQNRMLYYACRYPDQRKKFYFIEAEDVMELPSYLKQQLFSAYERIDQGTGDLKNLLSLPNS